MPRTGRRCRSSHRVGPRLRLSDQEVVWAIRALKAVSPERWADHLDPAVAEDAQRLVVDVRDADGRAYSKMFGLGCVGACAERPCGGQEVAVERIDSRLASGGRLMSAETKKPRPVDLGFLSEPPDGIEPSTYAYRTSPSRACH